MTNRPACVRHSAAKVADACGVSFGSGVMGCVYQVKNKVNGKKYIGKTIGKMKDRRKGHERNVNKGSSLLFHYALRKYGFDVFEWKVVVESDDEEELNSLERAMIRLLKTKVPNGYNLTDGGDGNGGWKQSPKTIAKRVKSLRGKKRTIQQRLNISRGHIESSLFQIAMKSLSRRAKIGRISKGRQPTLQCLAKAIEARRGSHHTEEARAKMSRALKEWWSSKVNREKMRKCRIGKPWSKKRRETYLKSKKVEVVRDV